MPESVKGSLTPAAQAFILHWGEMGTRWGVNRTVAQVHALLYLAEEPLPAEEIADTLAVARSNVSTSLRELQNWKLVETEHRLGDRRDFFRTSHDVWQLFLTVVEQRMERELLPTVAVLRRLADEAGRERRANAHVSERIGVLAAFLDDMVAWHGEMKRLPPATLRSLIRLGAGITKWLPGTRKGAKA